jgi:hypothetical protein
MNTSRRSLCIVSRDPLLCSELVLSLQASLNPDDEVEIVMDRRRARDVFDTKSGAPPVSVERRHNPEIDLAVRTKGFAIVPAVPMTSRPREEADAEERARFDNILSFKRRHESRSGRVVGAAGAVMVALILAPAPSGFFGRVLRDAPSSAAPAPRLDPADPSVAPPGASELVPPASHVPSGGPATLTRPSPAPSAVTRTGHPSSANGAIETYAGRVGDATGRVVSKAKDLIDRVTSEVIGSVPMNGGPEPPARKVPVINKRRPADSP